MWGQQGVLFCHCGRVGFTFVGLRTPQARWNHKVPSTLAHKAGSHIQRNYAWSFGRWEALQG